jgi:hypothetical protein
MVIRALLAAAGIIVATATQTADVTGNWTVRITSASGTIRGTASLRQVGGDVTGRIGPNDDPTIPLEGVLSGTTLTLTTNPQRGRTAAVQGGDVGRGRIEFVRTTR